MTTCPTPTKRRFATAAAAAVYALRQPRLHGRWVTALRDLTAALDERLAHAPAGSSWARRAEVFRHHLADRAAEAEALRDRARRAA